MRLKKDLFKRNRTRERQQNNIFKRTFFRMNFVAGAIVSGVIAPLVIATSFFSEAFLLMLANILLCCGNLMSFSHRFLSDEVSYFELSIMALGILVASALIFAYIPPVYTSYTLLYVVNIMSHFATAVNAYFLAQNTLLPFCKTLISYLLEPFGIILDCHHISKRDLSLAEDRFIIEHLFQTHYQHSTTESTKLTEELRPFNRLLQKLVSYLRKYNDPFLGNIINQEKILEIEEKIDNLTLYGDSSNAIEFIQRKIDFKRTKLSLYKHAYQEVSSINVMDTQDSLKNKLRFFHTVEININQIGKIKEDALEKIAKNIKIQTDKIISLESCLPLSQP